MTRAESLINKRKFPTGQGRAQHWALGREFRSILALTALHLPLGLLIYGAGPLAVLHPAAAFGLGMYWAINRRYRIELAALAIAYIVGAEVLWRMALVPIPWEFGKYGSAAIALIALIRRQNYSIPGPAVIYFAVLMPACIVTLSANTLADSQAILSTHISGPVLLAVACWFFSHCKFDPRKLRQLLSAIAIPLFSVAFATIVFTVSNEEIQFTGESNFATSGGFGPNQVSAMLGLGAFVSVVCLLMFRNRTAYSIYYMAAATVFAAQSVMTFSRGGMYNALGAIIAVTLVSMREPSVALKRMAPLVGLLVLFLVLIFPYLDDYTGGMLKDRFEDTGTSSRFDIAASDVELFQRAPFLGVGVGESYDLRQQILDHKAMSHTEFSRLLSEHGLFGIAALLILVWMIVSNLKRQNSVTGSAFVAGAAVWCCLFMTNTSTRLAAPSFMWGLMYSAIVALPANRKPKGSFGRNRNPSDSRRSTLSDGRIPGNERN